MRAGAANFSPDELADAVSLAHSSGVRVYLTCNTVPRSDEISRLPAFLEHARSCGVDALIVADIGVMSLAKKYAPGVALHVSTQTGVSNHITARALYDMGASRVVLARELTLDEISFIRANTPPELEIECFVHGSMCVSFSGRCLLSNYLTGRDANRGDCAQPCRWSYRLMEETRPGEYFPVFEDARGTHILNSRDMCMLEHVAELARAGISCFKIEGRAKSEYYVAVITNAYRCALSEYERSGFRDDFKVPKWIADEAYTVSHREYSTGFYFGGEPGQVTENGGYVRQYEVAAMVDGWDNGQLLLSQRNRFCVGDTLELLEPGCMPVQLPVAELFDGDGAAISCAPHPMMKLRIPFAREIPAGTVVRRRR